MHLTVDWLKLWLGENFDWVKTLIGWKCWLGENFDWETDEPASPSMTYQGKVVGKKFWKVVLLWTIYFNETEALWIVSK